MDSYDWPGSGSATVSWCEREADHIQMDGRNELMFFHSHFGPSQDVWSSDHSDNMSLCRMDKRMIF